MHFRHKKIIWASSRLLACSLACASWTFVCACKTTEPSQSKPPKLAPSPAKPDPKKVQEAKQTLQQFTTINDQVAKSLYQQGLALEEKGYIDEAIAQYLKAVKVKPSFAHDIYLQLGLLYRQKGQWDLAESAFSNAIEFNPRSALAYYHRALIWIQKADHAQAIESLNQALAINPSLAQAHHEMGKLLWDSNRITAAEHLNRYLALTKNPQDEQEIRVLLKQVPFGGRPIPRNATIPPQRDAWTP